MSNAPDPACQRREDRETIEHERALLGSLLVNPSLVGEMVSRVSREDFLDPQLGAVFAAVANAATGGRRSQPEIALGVIRSGHITFTQLGDLLGDVVDPGFGVYHATEVRDRSQRRADDPTAATKRASRLLDAYLRRIHDSELPQLYQLDDALDGLEVGPELITLIGAPPGFGKTALASQVMFEAMGADGDLVAYLLNAEMGFDAICRRELSRITRLPSDDIRFGRLSGEDARKIDAAAAQLRPALERLHVYGEPDLDSLRDLQGRRPGLVIVDYLQKFSPPDKDVRVGVGLVMNELRRLAKAGHAMLALSATKRDPKGGHNSQELSLSSFKESSEAEYQADSAYVLRDEGEVDGVAYRRKVTLAHVKNRHGGKVDRQLLFDMPAMRFERLEESAQSRPASTGNYNFYGDPDDSLEGYEDAR